MAVCAAAIAAVFYAGDGMEASGADDLIPVDVVLERDIDRSMARTVATHSVGRGLAKVERGDVREVGTTV